MKKNKLLIVVDMQNDFVTGVLGTKEAVAIVPNVVDKIRNWDGMIWFTKDLHGDHEFEEDFFKTEETKRIPKHCCSHNEEGAAAALIPELREIITIEEEEVDKNVFYKDIFSNDWWNEWTRPKLDLFDEIELIGVCTDICVISNALVLRSLDEYMPITVDASCCAGSSPEAHKAALMIMKNCCINVINED